MKILKEHQHITFGPYLAQMKMEKDFCKRLLETGKTLTKPYNNQLAGQIEKEFEFDLKKDTWIEKELEIYVNTWIDGYQRFSGDSTFDPLYRLASLWINFQKAGEYNPAHVHTGCNLTFIIYLEVPQVMLDEWKNPGKTRGAPPGCTTFTYGEDQNGMVTQRLIKPRENVILMFPAMVRHSVPHFTSKNVTRISVSGNIVFRTKPIADSRRVMKVGDSYKEMAAKI